MVVQQLKEGVVDTIQDHRNLFQYRLSVNVDKMALLYFVKLFSIIDTKDVISTENVNLKKVHCYALHEYQSFKVAL